MGWHSHKAQTWSIWTPLQGQWPWLGTPGVLFTFCAWYGWWLWKYILFMNIFKLCIYVSECALYSHVYMERVYSFCFFIFNKNEFCGYFCCFPLKKCNLGSRMPCLGSPRSPTFSLLYLFLNLALCSQKVWSEESFKTGTLLEARVCAGKLAHVAF